MGNDYFSSQAALYRRFRPHYPAQLFEFLRDAAPANLPACDCATGNGQAAVSFARAGSAVVAVDQSAAQLGEAEPHANVIYVLARAEKLPLDDHAIGLLSVAQALHWFDFPRFFDEALRVLRPGGLFAAWTYSFLAVSPQLGPELDRVIRWFYHDIVGPCWPPERRWVDAGYRGIEHPFEPLTAPALSITVTWDSDDLLGYVASWSAVQQYRARHARDPVIELAAALRPLWRSGDRRQLEWPLTLLCGRRR